MDVTKIRQDFPSYSSNPEGHIYLDSACQSLRPRQVIEAMDDYYKNFPACGGRSVHRYATKVSIKLEESRERVAHFINAEDPAEVVFTKNCTESLNLVAKGMKLKHGDVVVTTDIEHNSNHVPWLELQRSVGIQRRYSWSTEDGCFDIESFKSTMDGRVKLVSMVQTNNVNGTSIPIKDVTEIAHDHGAIVMIDGAQSAPHFPVDMRKMGIDLFGMSFHKMLGPSGMGALYGRAEVLDKLDPLISGGGSVLETTYDSATYLPLPEKLEAGLQNYSGIIGSGEAVEYLRRIGMEDVAEHERSLNTIITEGLANVPEVEVLKPLDPKLRGGIFSFNVKGMRSHDVAMILDEMAKIMIRSGNHCAHPYFEARKMEGCARTSLYIYNDREECKKFVEAVKRLVDTFAG